MVILVQQQLGALLHVLKVKWEMAFAMISTTKLNVNSIKVRSFLITIREITSLLLWKGDCCGPDVVKGSCYSCICHEDSPLDPSCEPSFIGDGYCDDFNNVPGCAYDDGMCSFYSQDIYPYIDFLTKFQETAVCQISRLTTVTNACALKVLQQGMSQETKGPLQQHWTQTLPLHSQVLKQLPIPNVILILVMGTAMTTWTLQPVTTMEVT